MLLVLLLILLTPYYTCSLFRMVNPTQRSLRVHVEQRSRLSALIHTSISRDMTPFLVTPHQRQHPSAHPRPQATISALANALRHKYHDRHLPTPTPRLESAHHARPPSSTAYHRCSSLPTPTHCATEVDVRGRTQGVHGRSGQCVQSGAGGGEGACCWVVW